MEKQKFKFNLGDMVSLKSSGETGIVRGRAEWSTCCNQYSVHGVGATKEHFDKWFDEDLLVLIEA